MALAGAVLACGWAHGADSGPIAAPASGGSPDAVATTAPIAARRSADFAGEPASPAVRHVAHWAVHSDDPAGLPFIIVDKVDPRVYVFTAAGRLVGTAPALVGSAIGDVAVEGIGQRKLSEIRPAERTTPSGRFVAGLARAPGGEEILWVDYDGGVALHRVITTSPKERRLQRLQSLAPADRRITYGCINVPVRFFETVVAPLVRAAGGIVYVLPESRAAAEVFGSYDVLPPTPP